MSGRVANSDRTKKGELVSAELMSLTKDQGGEASNPARITSEYKVRKSEMAGEAESSDEEETRKRFVDPETPGRSKDLSKYLAKLPSREKAMMESRSEPFSGRGRRGRKLEIAKHKEGDTHEYPAKDADALRKEILSVSLFPNLYNRSTLLRGM